MKLILAWAVWTLTSFSPTTGSITTTDTSSMLIQDENGTSSNAEREDHTLAIFLGTFIPGSCFILAMIGVIMCCFARKCVYPTSTQENDDYHLFEAIATPTTRTPEPPPENEYPVKTKPPAPPPKPSKDLPSVYTPTLTKKLPLLPERKAYTFERVLESNSTDDFHNEDRAGRGKRTLSSPASVVCPVDVNKRYIVVEHQCMEIETGNKESGKINTPAGDKDDSRSNEESVDVMEENYTIPNVLTVEIPTCDNIAYNRNAMTTPKREYYTAEVLELDEMARSQPDAESLPNHSYDEPHTFWCKGSL